MREPILARVATGDAGAVGACLDEYGGMVYGLARRYLEPLGGDVEDAVQEIFVEVWRCAGRYDASLGSEASFIATIAHRRLIDAQRRIGTRLHLQATYEPTPKRVEAAASPAMADDLRRAAHALSRLDPDERHVLELAL
ncbi:MAG: sigma-70 family RNA polymerase sigma factor, partial [Phycisphaerales bacterium]|nr:sigma-70 family RNA polymerase sigma factor [Phycisphaerales bacterium]